MNLSKPATGPLPNPEHSKKNPRLCPYCLYKGQTGEHLIQWQSRSVTFDVVTRWTRCESCFAMWREVYNWAEHKFEYKEHWTPRE